MADQVVETSKMMVVLNEGWLLEPSFVTQISEELRDLVDERQRRSVASPPAVVVGQYHPKQLMKRSTYRSRNGPTCLPAAGGLVTLGQPPLHEGFDMLWQFPLRRGAAGVSKLAEPYDQ